MKVKDIPNTRWQLPSMVLAVCAVALTVAACGGSENESSSSGGESAEGEVKTVLLNNFMGNTWRPVMMRSAELLAQEPPLEGVIDGPELVVTENTAQAQNAALNSALLEDPDLILIDAADATASNQAIERVCAEGVTVVSFDVLVTAPCAWKVAIDFREMGRVMAEWMMKEIGGEGTVFLDQGQAGATAADDFQSGAREVLDEYPDVEVKTYFAEFSPGGEQAAVSNLVNTNKDVDGILGFAYGAPALAALTQAGVDPVPVTGFAYNGGLVACNEMKVDCLFKSSPAWVSGEAMLIGNEVINGERTGEPETVILDTPFFVSGKTKPDTADPVESIGDIAQPDLAEGIMLPLSPDWAELDPQEVLTPPDVG